MDLLQFRLRISENLLSFGQRLKPSPMSIGNDSRFDGIGHLVSEAGLNRCAHCKNNTSYKCIKCERFAHPKCFVAYHTK